MVPPPGLFYKMQLVDVRSGFPRNGEVYGTEGALEKLTEVDYLKHAYEIDEEGVYL